MEKKLDSLLSPRVEKQIPSEDAPLMAFTAEGGVEPKGERYDRSYLVKSEDKLYKRTEYNDFIYSSNNLDVGSIGLNKYGTAVISDVYEIFSVLPDNLPTFISELIQRPHNIAEILKYRQGCLYGQYRIYAEDFLSVSVLVPEKAEQERISSFLDALDNKINHQARLIKSLKKYKRGLVFSIFSTSTPYEIAVESTPLTTLLKEYRNRETTNLRVCSVAVAKGVVDQLEHLGRRFAASDTSNYGRVKPGDVVYTKSPTGDFPYGIVKQSWLHEDVAVSPLYGVYTPLNYEVGYLIHTYFEQSSNANNHLRTLAQKGAKNTINITTGHFLDKDIPFPIREDEVSMLVGLFSRINKRIDNEESRLNKLVLQRKALMQQLFI